MKVAVGLSGGVDSTVAALLLREQGHEVIGVTMALGRADEARSLAEADAAARRLDIPLRVFDLAKAWSEDVLRYVGDTYRAGRTPNPCVRCNERVKFGLLPRLAFGLGCERFATGHYVRTVVDTAGRVRLFRAADRSKDQSYFLYRVAPEILTRTVFPLGEMAKDDVRAKARAFGLAVADKTDSQDFCGGDPAALVEAEPREGNIVTADGKVLGRHKGYWNYTIGKRKGLGIGGGIPYYVVGLRAATNEVVVGFKDESFVREFKIADIVRFSSETKGELSVKVRSAGEPKGPVAWSGDTVSCPDGLSGIAPGQSAVFFQGDEIVGGGIIV